MENINEMLQAALAGDNVALHKLDVAINKSELSEIEIHQIILTAGKAINAENPVGVLLLALTKIEDEDQAEEVTKLLKLAVNAGNSYAMLLLGYSEQMRENYSIAIELYKKAIERDSNPYAKTKLAYLYLNSLGCNGMEHVAIILLEEANAANDPEACVLLARCLENNSTPDNVSKAAILYEKAYRDHNNAEAAFLRAELAIKEKPKLVITDPDNDAEEYYAYDARCNEQDVVAFQWYQYAADLNYPPAIFAVGYRSLFKENRADTVRYLSRAYILLEMEQYPDHKESCERILNTLYSNSNHQEQFYIATAFFLEGNNTYFRQLIKQDMSLFLDFLTEDKTLIALQKIACLDHVKKIYPVQMSQFKDRAILKIYNLIVRFRKQSHAKQNLYLTMDFIFKSWPVAEIYSKLCYEFASYLYFGSINKGLAPLQAFKKAEFYFSNGNQDPGCAHLYVELMESLISPYKDVSNESVESVKQRFNIFLNQLSLFSRSPNHEARGESRLPNRLTS